VGLSSMALAYLARCHFFNGITALELGRLVDMSVRTKNYQNILNHVNHIRRGQNFGDFSDAVTSHVSVLLFFGFPMRKDNSALHGLEMRRSTVILDGLWFCLCPSFRISTSYNTRLPFTRGKRPQRHDSSSAALTTPRRCLNTAVSKASEEPKAQKRNRKEGNDSVRSSIAHQSSQQSQLNSERREHISAPRSPSIALPPSPGVPKNLEERSTPELENRLQELATGSPKILSASQILRILIRDRHVRPEVRHYRALILANSDAERGSPEVVRQLLSEMEKNGIPADSGTLHAALQVWQSNASSAIAPFTYAAIIIGSRCPS
jgi:hypothetical protein